MGVLGGYLCFLSSVYDAVDQLYIVKYKLKHF